MKRTLIALSSIMVAACGSVTSLSDSEEEFDNYNGSTHVRKETSAGIYEEVYSSNSTGECIRPTDNWEIVLTEFVLNQPFDGPGESKLDGNELNEPKIRIKFDYKGEKGSVERVSNHGLKEGNNRNYQGDVVMTFNSSSVDSTADIRHGDLTLNIQIFELDEQAESTIDDTKEIVNQVLASPAFSSLLAPATNLASVQELSKNLSQKLEDRLLRNDLLANHQITFVQCGTLTSSNQVKNLYLMEGTYVIARVPPAYNIQEHWNDESKITDFTYAKFVVRKRQPFPVDNQGSPPPPPAATTNSDQP